MSPGEAAPAKSRFLKPLLGLQHFILRYKGKLALAGVGLVLGAGAVLALPIAVRQVIDHGFSGSDPAYVNRAFLTLFAIAAVMAAASATRFYCVTWLGERAVADMREAAFRHLT